jgi:hypothetical protein
VLSFRLRWSRFFFIFEYSAPLPYDIITEETAVTRLRQSKRNARGTKFMHYEVEDLLGAAFALVSARGYIMWTPGQLSRAQCGLTYTKLQLSALWPHLGALQAASSLSVVWRWSAQRVSGPSSHAEQELQRRRNPWATTGRTSFSKYTTPNRWLATPISIRRNHRSKTATVFRKTVRIRTPSGQPLQAKKCKY